MQFGLDALGPGVYVTNPPAWRTRAVVIGELPRDRSTLLFRVLGSPAVRRLALQDLAALPAGAWDNPPCINVINGCPFPIWIHAQANAGVTLTPDDAALNRGMLAQPTSTDATLYYETAPYNPYAKWVHATCPGIYAFAYDDYPSAAGQSGFRSCTADRLDITFCLAG